MLTYILFVLGFIILVKGADLLVDGSICIAKRLKVSDLLIGLTIVSFGTSAPELIVNIFASGAGESDLAIGNIFGSNILNILLILGISSAIYPLVVKEIVIKRSIPIAIMATAAVGILANDFMLYGRPSILSKADGFILLLGFAAFLYYAIGIRDNTKRASKNINIPKSFLLILLGILGLGFGGKWIVEGAVYIGNNFGLSQSFMGLTILAIGTSLPELATSAVAAYKKNAQIAVGNVVGSNIFNLLWILGISSIVRELPYKHIINVDLGMVMLACFLLLFFMVTGKKNVLERRQGIFFILIYFIYLLYLIVRG